jgi:hypothetical protein
MLVRLKHPDSENPIEVEAERSALYIASGWVVIKDEPKPPARPAPKRRTATKK